MNITYTFRHTLSSDGIRTHAAERLEKISHFAAEPIDVHVIIDSDGHHQMKAEVDFRAKGIHSNAQSSGNGEDGYKVLDEAIAKITRQLKKHKERIKAHA